jgi:hypothetical protein
LEFQTDGTLERRLHRTSVASLPHLIVVVFLDEMAEEIELVVLGFG